MNINLEDIISYTDNFSKPRHLLRAYMKDVYPGIEIRTTNILLNVYEAGIAKNLSTMASITSPQYRAFINRLQHDYGMTVESSVEALNVWIDVLIKKGAGTRFGNTLVKTQETTKKATKPETKPSFSVVYGINDTIYEDENIAVKLVGWKRNCFLVGGWARVATFVFENKSSNRYCIYMKDISIGGFLNQEISKSSYAISGGQKGMNDIQIVYEDKVPGNISNFKSVELKVCYGIVKDGCSYPNQIIGQTIGSETISIHLS